MPSAAPQPSKPEQRPSPPAASERWTTKQRKKIRSWLVARRAEFDAWWDGLSGTSRASVSAFLLVALVWAAFVLTLPPAQTRSILKTRAETLAINVIHPRLSAIRIGRVRLINDGLEQDQGRCVSGLLIPAAGTRIVYSRSIGGRLGIALMPGSGSGLEDRVATIPPPEGLSDAAPARIDLSGPHRLLADDSCTDGQPISRLPIHGEAEFGREFRPATETQDAGAGTLSEGKITIFGLSNAWFLWLRVWETSFYPVSSLDVPAGARLYAESLPHHSYLRQISSTLRRIFSKANIPAPPRSIWWGLASIDPGKGGFDIEVSTDADRIVMVIPGVDADVSHIRIGDHVQLLTDPNLLKAQTFLASCLGGFNLLMIFLGWLQQREERRKKRQTERVS